jgi:hypothetical protein
MAIKFNPFLSNFDIVGSGGGVTSVNGHTGVVQLNADDIPYDNSTSDLTATDVQEALDEIQDSLLNSLSVAIYVDSINGDDTTGTGSVIYPVQSINKAIDLCTNPLLRYVIKPTPGDYNGADVDWLPNVDLMGSGPSTNIQQLISYVAQVGDEAGFTFSNVSCNVFMDFDDANTAIITLADGVFQITRDDSRGIGPWVIRVNDSTLGDFDVKGNNLLSNCLFVSNAVVRTDSQLLCSDTIIGIQLDLEGTAVIGLTGCTVSGTLNGTTIGLDTPTVQTDASSLTGATLVNMNVTLSDNSTYVSYDNTISGLTASTVKTAIDELSSEKIDLTEKGANNGVATLDAGGKVPVTQLPNSVMEYQGAWDAATNTPTLIDGTGNSGDVYRVSVAGTQDLGSGNQTFDVGDFVIYNGTIWQWSGGSDAVLSVNGQQGIVVLDTDDINEGATNLYFTDERAQDAVGTILVDSSNIDLTYNDGTPSISADLTNTTAVAGIYGDASNVGQFEVDAKGRIIDAVDVPIVVSSGSITGFDEAAQDAVGGILVDTSTINLTYTDATPEITADIVNDSITDIHINSAAAIARSKLESTNANEVVINAGDGSFSSEATLAPVRGGTGLDGSGATDGQLLIGNGTGYTLANITTNQGITITDGPGSINIDTIAIPAPGDLNQISFTLNDNQSTPLNITGLTFSGSLGFKAYATVQRGNEYAFFNFQGFDGDSGYVLNQDFSGSSNTGVTFTITGGGQIQYTSTSTGNGGLLNIRALAIAQ